MKKATGVGGIFFKCKDTKTMMDWYSKNLGLPMNEYGSTFESRNIDDPKEINYLQWSLFKQDSDYFDPSEQPFMINYRVENLVSLVEELKKEGVTICDDIAEYDYGKFVHILDPEGNKIELWEPIDKVLTDWNESNTTK